VVLVIGAMLALTGCDHRVDGHPVVGSHNTDPAYFVMTSHPGDAVAFRVG